MAAEAEAAREARAKVQTQLYNIHYITLLYDHTLQLYEKLYCPCSEHSIDIFVSWKSKPAILSHLNLLDKFNKILLTHTGWNDFNLFFMSLALPGLDDMTWYDMSTTV